MSVHGMATRDRAALAGIRQTSLAGRLDDTAWKAVSRLLAVLLALLASGVPTREVARDEGRLGRVRVASSPTGRAGLVLLLSDTGGSGPALDGVAARLAAAGAVVVEVELPAYLRGLRESSDGCHYVISEIEDLSKRLERELGFEGYRSPILAGIGAGGTLAYAALAQSPSATVAGAVSVDPAVTLDTKVPLCPGAASTPGPEGGYSYAARTGLPGFWWVSSRRPLPDALAAIAGTPPDAPPPSAAPEERLERLLRAALTAGAHAEPRLADLPLVELSAAAGAQQMAVIYSGDGGWRDLDKQIGGVLARAGTPVVGVDSLRYFWREKTPDRVAADLDRILHHYRDLWGARRALLIGYSFGAGILPFAVNRLPPESRASVVQISLLGLAPRAPFAFHVTGWVGVDARDSLPVAPELRGLDMSRVQCFYGAEEEDTLCTAPELAGAERIRTGGGHHFDGDYTALARRILEGAKRRAAASGPPARGSE